MGKGQTRVLRWTMLWLVLVFTLVSSGVIMLTPQRAEAALTMEQARAAQKKFAAGGLHSLAIQTDGCFIIALGGRRGACSTSRFE